MRFAWTLIGLLVCAVSFGQATQAANPAALLAAVDKMPAQIAAGTFDEDALFSLLNASAGDPNLDMSIMSRYLAMDMRSENIQVHNTAIMIVRMMAIVRRREQRTGLELLYPIILDCFDRSVESGRSHDMCWVLVTVFPGTAPFIMQLRELFAKQLADGTVAGRFAGAMAFEGLHDPESARLFVAFLGSTNVPDNVKADAIQMMPRPMKTTPGAEKRTSRNPVLPAVVEQAMAGFLEKTKSDRVKIAIIQISEAYGSAAIEPERETLIAIGANQSEGPAVKDAAADALRMIAQPQDSVTAIH